MTILGKIIVTLGIGIFTTSTLLWIIQGNWQWFAGGGAVFIGTLFTALVVSAETKPTTSPSRAIRPFQPDRPPVPTNQHQHYLHDTQEIPTTTTDWVPPPQPPPDEIDPFSRPSSSQL